MTTRPLYLFFFLLFVISSEIIQFSRDQLLKSIIKAIQNSNYEIGQEQASTLIENEPKNPQNYLILGQILSQQGKFSEAVPVYREGINVEQKYMFNHNQLGLNLLYINRQQQAKKSIQKAQEIAPNHPLPLCAGGEYLFINLDIKSSKPLFQECLNKVLDVDDEGQVPIYNVNDRIYVAMAMILHVQQFFEEADFYALKAIDLNPKFFFPYYFYGINLLEQKRYQEAEENILKSIELGGRQQFTVLPLLVLRIQQEKLQEALQLSNQMVDELQLSSISYFYRGLIYSALKKLPEAGQNFMKALELDSFPVDFQKQAYISYIFNQFGLGKVEQARDGALKVIQEYPQFSRGYFALGVIYRNTNRFEEAKINLEKAIQLDPQKFAFDYLSLGFTLQALNEIDKAHEAFQKAYDLDPQTISIAFPEFPPFISKKPTPEEILKENPNSPTLNNKAGQCLIEEGKFQQSLDYFQRAIELDDQNPLFYVNAAEAFINLGQIQAAADAYERALKIKKDAIYYRDLADIQRFLFQAENALPNIEKAIELKDDDPQLYYLRAKILEMDEDYPEALKAVKKAIELDPENQLYAGLQVNIRVLRKLNI